MLDEIQKHTHQLCALPLTQGVFTLPQKKVFSLSKLEKHA